MPTAVELFKSRPIRATQLESEMTRKYIVDTDDPYEAVQATVVDAPDYGDQYETSGMYVAEKTAERSESVAGKCTLDVIYRTPSISGGGGGGVSLNETEWNIDFGAQTGHIVTVEGEAWQMNYPLTHSFGSVIGRQADGNVEGVDIYIPHAEITASVWRTAAFVTPTYMRTLYEMSPSVNDDNFTAGGCIWASGELLFVGPRIRMAPSGPVQLEFRFLGELNRSDITIYDVNGDVITSTGAPAGDKPSKEGHQYLWIHIGQSQAAGTDARPKTGPLSAHVATIYDYSDFSDLQIP